MKVLPVFFVALFASLLASFPARNPDVFKHLAYGKQLATDFHLPAEDCPDAESSRCYHGWLYDLLSYVVYSVGGGAGLVFVKVLVAAAIAVLLFQLCKSGTGSLLPAACTVLALLTMSAQFSLQPSSISCLFFALTIRYHQAEIRNQREEGELAKIVPPWRLLCLFVIWANMDSWFLLGLAVAALAWLGRPLDARRFDNAGSKTIFRGTLSLGILAAVCLVNPYHLHAYAALPNQWASALSSPFQKAYLSTIGRNPAGLSFFLLLGLGLIGFILNARPANWRRLLPWLGLAILSCLQATAIPFFAVLSAPMLSWNLREWSSRRTGQTPGAGVSISSKHAPAVLATVLGIILVVCAWPGWLQSPPYEPRCWAIDIDPSLAKGAAVTRAWHKEGKFAPNAGGLHLHSASASAFAWLCPEDNGLLDQSLALAVLNAPNAPAVWEDRLRKAKINHLIVYQSDSSRLFAALGNLLANPDHWSLLYLEGTVAVFGWRDHVEAKSNPVFQGHDLNQFAFHPRDDQKAPRKRPQSTARQRTWLDGFWKPIPAQTVDQNEAVFYWLYAEALRSTASQRNTDAWEWSQSAGLIASAGNWSMSGCMLECDVRLVLFRPQVPAPAPDAMLPPLDQLAFASKQMFALGRDDTSPALLYLGLRAARRALAANPADHRAHMVLGECYLRLLQNTRERIWSSRLKQLSRLRRVQASAALNQAVLLRPGLAAAHRDLSRIYQEAGYLDLALKHLHMYRKFQGGNRSDEPRFLEQDRLDLELNRLTEKVQESNSKFAAGDRGRVLDRAMLAAQLGLAGKALELLLESDVSAFGHQGMMLELELLLNTGRAREVRDWLSREQAGKEAKAMLGEIPYLWFRSQALAAEGDYALAQEELTQLALAWRGAENLGPREKIALAVGKAVLDEQPLCQSPAHFLWQLPSRLDFRTRILGLARNLREEANTTVLRGLLALEEGETDNARFSFRTALALWRDDAKAASGAGLEFNGRLAAQDCLKWLE